MSPSDLLYTNLFGTFSVYHPLFFHSMMLNEAAGVKPEIIVWLFQVKVNDIKWMGEFLSDADGGSNLSLRNC